LATASQAGGTIEIDLRTKIVQQHEQVYVLFPGEEHSLYNNIVRRSAVYLDLPAFQIGGAKAAVDVSQMTERLALSDRVRNWHKNGRPEDKVPSRDLNDYRRASDTNRRGLLGGALERLYFQMKPGDLVVVPGPGIWTDVYIGEVLGEPTVIRDEDNYPSEEIPARRVRWLTHKPKRAFSEDLVRRLGTPNYLIQLDRSLRDEIFASAYDNYIYNGKYVSKFTTSEHSFSTLDDFNIQAFVNFISGVLAAAEGDAPAGMQFTLDDALEILHANPDLIPSLTVNINSPGALTVFKDTILPIVLAAFMALATSAHADAGPGHVKFVNSLAPATDLCAVQVDAAVKDAFTMMNYDSWKKACYRIQDAKKQTGISTSVTVTRSPPHPGSTTEKSR